MPYEVLVRYGRWDEILAEPMPAEKYVFSRALLLAARGIALAAKGRPADARGGTKLPSSRPRKKFRRRLSAPTQ